MIYCFIFTRFRHCHSHFLVFGDTQLDLERDLTAGRMHLLHDSLGELQRIMITMQSTSGVYEYLG